MNKIATIYKIGGGNLANDPHAENCYETLAEQYFGLDETEVDTAIEEGREKAQWDDTTDNHAVPEDNAHIMRKDIARVLLPRLLPSEEGELGLRVKAGTSIDDQGRRVLDESATNAQHRLFLCNTKLALKIAAEFKYSLSYKYISMNDLKQEALRALFDSCGRYDGRGKFSNYAGPCIRGHLRTSVNVANCGFRNGPKLRHFNYEVRGILDRAELNGELLSLDDIRRHLVKAQCQRFEAKNERKPNKIERKKIAKLFTLERIDWVITHAPAEIRPHPQALDEANLENLRVADEGDFDNQDLLSCDRAKINLVVSTLPARERWIIQMRFGLGDKTEGRNATLSELGRSYGISRETIRKIQNKGLERLRTRLREFAPDAQNV